MTNAAGTTKLGARLEKLRASARLTICFGVGLTTLAICVVSHIALLTSALLAWDTFCLAMIALSWIMFFGIDAAEVQLQAQRQDESRYGTFLLSLCASCVSMVGILLLMHRTGSTPSQESLHRLASLLGVGFSWILLHTLFTLRYAHLYYNITENGDSGKVGGLDFPDEKAPDYVDFAYFSFVLGMTFQVSDVSITDRGIRRIVLLHSVIAFVFNTIVVALSVSLLSDLRK